jgi:hypothetical protein
MKTWSVFDPKDGQFTGHIISGPASALTENLPPTMQAIEGRFDRLSQRVDIESGAVVEYQPPQPDVDHEWNAQTKRWEKRPDVVQREIRRTVALAKIAELELNQQRPMREDRLRPTERDQKDGKLPRERLQEIEDEIAALRAQL